MTIQVDISHRLQKFSLEAKFRAERGLIALFGPSGSGKTTLVKIVAGLLKPDSGSVSVNGATLVDTARGIFVPVHQRQLGYVFQEGRLFPHLTVRQNLLYGKWFSGVSVSEGEVSRITDLLGIAHLEGRHPGRLSGGEKQRVAIGRALLSSPRLLLLDEPLSSLDEARKQEILPYLERLREEENIPIVYVSHSAAEVARLSNTMVILSEGRVVATGPTSKLMRRLDLIPATGDDPGALIEGVILSHSDADGLTTIRSRGGDWRVPRLDLTPGSRVRMRIRARDIIIAKQKPEDISALNAMPCVLRAVAAVSEAIADLELDCGGDILVARLTRASVDRLQLREGAAIFAIIKSVSFDRSMLGGPWHAQRTGDADATAD